MYPGLVSLNASVLSFLKGLEAKALAAKKLAGLKGKLPQVKEVAQTTSQAKVMEVVRVWKPLIVDFQALLNGAEASWTSENEAAINEVRGIFEKFRQSLLYRAQGIVWGHYEKYMGALATRAKEVSDKKAAAAPDMAIETATVSQARELVKAAPITHIYICRGASLGTTTRLTDFVSLGDRTPARPSRPFHAIDSGTCLCA